MNRLLLPPALLAFAFSAKAHAQMPALELDLGGGVTMDMLLVRPGSFQQGSPPGEAGREADEGPQRRVTISQAYYMAKFPVTRGQFARFAEAARFRTEAEKGESGGYGVVNGKLVQQKQFTWRNPGFAQTDDHPVVLVSWADAAAFCQWLTTKTGRLCELPTEAQWELACRAGSTLAHYAEPVDAVAWYRQNSGGTTQAVGGKRANAWGFHDFYGPVWQWCRDWYGPYPPGNANDPFQANARLSDKPRRVLRGGSFLSDVSHARSAERYRNDAGSRNADNGFRIVCAVAPRSQGAAAPGAAGPPAPVQRRLISPPGPVGDGPGPEPEDGNVFLGLLILLAVPLGFVAVVLWLIVRFFRRQGRAAPPPLTGNGLTGPEAAALLSTRPAPLAHRFGFNLADDGFFITGPDDAAGSHLRYECNVAGREIADDLVFTPGPEGHFIFTGKRPSSVRVQTTGGAAGTSSTVISSGTDDDFPRSSYRSSSGSSRYPSAY